LYRRIPLEFYVSGSMKLLSLLIINKDSSSAKVLQGSYELSSFGYFQQKSVKEFLNFTSKLVVERTQTSLRSTVKEQEYLCHVYVRPDNLAGVLISDQEYPQRVGQTLLTKVLEEFAAMYSSAQWSGMTEGSGSCKRVDEFLQKYQNPREADAMMKLQNDLDETKIILHGTLEALLQRGEKLDDLVERSEGLSMQSKMFYQTAKKTNRCCVIL
jgi:synaptobrevin homolog YKT6